MSHEPECFAPKHDDACPGYALCGHICTCDELRAAYRRGYNDHARTVQHWQDTHGAYRQQPEVEHHDGHCPQCRDRVDFHYQDDDGKWFCRYCPCDMQFIPKGLVP